MGIPFNTRLQRVFMPSPKIIELSNEKRVKLLERLSNSNLNEEDIKMITDVFETLQVLSEAYEKKNTSIKRILKMFFGKKSEKSKNILNKNGRDEGSSSANTSSDQGATEKKKKKKGHGRNGASSYTGADKSFVPHPNLVPGGSCPECITGKVYRLQTPQVFVQIEGRAPVSATVTEYEQFRCNLCSKIFTSKPSEIKSSKSYDETAGAMIALLKYGYGFPFYRFEKFQQSLGIPLPSSTQWDIIKSIYKSVYPVYSGLIRLAAQGEIIHNDDTPNKILDLMKAIEDEKRTGIYTTGIISQIDGRNIALFYSGRNHAGENLEDLLMNRDGDRSPPIQMCDALSRNSPGDIETILCNCLTHGRRYFVDIISSYPDECQHVIKQLAKVYKIDDDAKKRQLDIHERLDLHQKKSCPVMEKLHEWLNNKIIKKKVEPNSNLGTAINYMLNHWKPLTRFLKVPGAPLDNNICERALKIVILNRKNAYFYKSCFGASVGDLFMSIIHTCSLSKINPFNYLVALQKYSKEVFQYPEKWMPWNYQLNSVTSV